ncbi:hypothetical protein WA556_003731, partial [Blastocystis sp. ATCC 50177/Nand II]
MTSVAFILCLDNDTTIEDGSSISFQTKHLDSCVTSGILTLHNCGVKHFVLVLPDQPSDVLDEFISFFTAFLPDCILRFDQISDSSAGIGDLLVEKRQLLSQHETVYLTSWRTIPSEMELRAINEDTQHDAVLYGLLRSSGVAFHSASHELVDPDSVQDSQPIAHIAPLGLARLRTSLFSHLESGFPFVHPTTLLQLLLHLNRCAPHSVAVVPRSASPRQRSIVFAPTPSATPLAVCLDGTIAPLTVTAPVGSVLRYSYLQRDTQTSVTAWEARAIPRELRVPEGEGVLLVRDVVGELRPCRVLEEETEVLIACDHWRWNREVALVGARGEQARSVRVTPNCVMCVFAEGAIGAVTVEVEVVGAKEEVVFAREEIEAVANTLSLCHGDGCVRKRIHDRDVAFHLTVVTPTTAPHLRPALCRYTPAHTPMCIGHRGCGMNTIPRQTEVENSLRGFAEAARRGLHTVEFDLQLTSDHHVVVFHDYEIKTPSGEKWPIAAKTLAELRSIPLPAPEKFDGPVQFLPRMSKMFGGVPGALGFNIEVKYPMPSELDMAKLNVTKNDYVDRIVRCVEAADTARSVYYSSFDLDCCLMLLRKQARFPVFLLLDEESGCAEVSKEQWLQGVWLQYVQMALERGALRGVVACTTLLNAPAVKWLHAKGLLVYCWGNDGNDAGKRKELAEMGVDAIIAD